MAFNPDEPKAGQALSARLLSEFFAELERLGKLVVVWPLTIAEDAAGIRLGAEIPEIWAVEITGGGPGGDYDWTRKKREAGAWVDHPGDLSGTAANDPAHELNANEDVDFATNPIVWAWRDPATRTLLFQVGAC